MLRLPNTYDPRIHKMVQEYLTERILDLVDDFALLDSFSEGQLADAPAELGIGMEGRSRKFMLPPDWLEDE